METAQIVYNDRISRQFVAASVLWGAVGMLVGVVIALQMAFWQANLGPWLSFGRLRPLHTNAVIFAFVGNMMFAGVYYSTQRLTKARLPSDLLAAIHFWGWQLIIVAAAVTLPLGLSQGKEYAELEWPIDIAIAVIWVVFAINFFWTLARRRERQLYVALWFYISTVVTIAVLHIVNSLAMPVSLTKSYSLFGGVQDALVQWWYGHNAVAFFLTTPILGIMYYFLPKAAERPVFSYRLSIIHFWSLVFIYIWAGPHHLLYTALPDWAQTLGMIFSLMLWAPSWGGMLNGLLTLRGAWQKLRTDPVLKFFAAGVTFYGMATFEGPLLSIKSINGLAHYTDWIIGHVHSGALGWNGFMAAGMFYWMVPRLYNTKLHSEGAANTHFYLATFGIILYVISMWVSGITQGLMWRADGEAGGLQYPNFVETLLAIRPMYWIRLIGGSMYLVGFVIMAWNLWKTARSGQPVDGTATVSVATPSAAPLVPWGKIAFGSPVLVSAAVVLTTIGAAFASIVAGTVLIFVAFLIALIGFYALALSRDSSKPTWHHLLEGRGLIFTAWTVVAVLIGGVAQIIPTLVSTPAAIQVSDNKPYSPLQLAGRDVYLREGCYTCHSQMIRPFVWESARYGAVSKDTDSVFDHPFQWGSKRTGPDLARIGGRYSNLWHYQHMIDPRSISPGSNMPSYAHLEHDRIRFADLSRSLRAQRSVGVPYSAADVAAAPTNGHREAAGIVANLQQDGKVRIAVDSELVALIAYLQRVGRVPAAAQAAVPARDAANGAQIAALPSTTGSVSAVVATTSSEERP